MSVKKGVLKLCQQKYKAVPTSWKQTHFADHHFWPLQNQMQILLPIHFWCLFVSKSKNSQGTVCTPHCHSWFVYVQKWKFAHTCEQHQGLVCILFPFGLHYICIPIKTEPIESFIISFLPFCIKKYKRKCQKNTYGNFITLYWIGKNAKLYGTLRVIYL